MTATIDAPDNIVRPLAATPPLDGNAPRAPYPSNLLLDREQEDMVMDRCDAWERALKSSSGWDETANEAEYLYNGEGSDPLMVQGEQERRHFVKRAFYRAMSENQWEWRAWMYPNSIFAKTNLNAPLARRISRAMAAKAINYFFGTQPYFVCYPVGPSDERTAESIQKVAEGKLDNSKGTAALRDAVQTAFDLGETVLKVAHKRKQSLYKKKDVVLGDAAGKPVLGADGEYITRADLWVATGPVNPDGTPAPGAVATLARDGVTVKPPGSTWLTGHFARVTTHYVGPEIQEIYYRNFLAPLDAPSLQDAECLLHMFEISPNQLAAMFTDSRTSAQIVQAVELLRGLEGVSPVSAVDPVARANNQPASTKIAVQEFWMKVDADGDGITEDICFVRVKVGGQWCPLFYDYVQNVTDTKERPFYPVVPIRRKGSWTGIGAMEMFEKHQEVVDLMLNRWSFAVSSAGTLTVFDPAAFEQTSGERRDLELNTGKGLTLLAGKDIDKVLKRFPMDDNIGPAWQQIMQFFLQLAMNESGVQHANDGAMAGMDTTKLATGIRNVERAGNEVFGVFVSCLEDGITDAIRAFIQTLYARITTKEVVHILEDKIPVAWQVEPRDVAGLEFDVQIMLSRYRTEQMMESVRAVLPDCMSFYTLAPAVQARLTPLFHQLLKAAQINNPDRIIAPLTEYTPEEIAASMQFAASLPPEIQQMLAPALSLASGMVPQEEGGQPGQQPQPQPAAA